MIQIIQFLENSVNDGDDNTLNDLENVVFENGSTIVTRRNNMLTRIDEREQGNDKTLNQF